MAIELTGLEGETPAGKVAIVVSRYNTTITDQLLQGAKETLVNAGMDEADVLIVRVPGAWELPLPTSQLISRKDVAAVIAIGAVIKGETTHDEHINRSVCNSLQDIGIAAGKPVLLGLLTCNTIDQAIQRAGGNMGNKGAECAEAALEMIRLMDAIAEQATPTVGFNR